MCISQCRDDKLEWYFFKISKNDILQSRNDIYRETETIYHKAGMIYRRAETIYRWQETISLMKIARSSWAVYFKMIPILIFSQPPLISFKCDKNIGNFLVRSAFQTSNQAGTFKYARAWCKTCPFICNVEKLSGQKRSIKITDHLLVPQPMSSTV